jgi:predicted nucleotidyltransferase
MDEFSSRTALDLSPEEWKRYDPTRATIRRKGSDRVAIALRRRRALRTAQKAAHQLREKFGAQRVVLFGSLSKKRKFTLWSDIDLAAWGIPSQHFYEAVAEVTALSAEFKIDLVDPQSCRPSLRQAIEQDGTELR